MYRRMVLDRERGVRLYVVLNVVQFKQCLMSVSANADYAIGCPAGRWVIGTEPPLQPLEHHLRRPSDGRDGGQGRPQFPAAGVDGPKQLTHRTKTTPV